jgi:hypothetical protein
MVPISFLSNGLGASVGPVKDGHWRILYFGHTVDLYPYQQGARFDGRQVMLPTPPQTINGTLYVPWTPLAELFGVRWRIVSPQPASDGASTASNDAGPVVRSGVEYSHRVRRHRLSQRPRPKPKPTRRRFCCNIRRLTFRACGIRFLRSAHALQST